jgi:hypothetical protein
MIEDNKFSGMIKGEKDRGKPREGEGPREREMPSIQRTNV